ncbi:DUF6494 family protein [Halomonas sp. 328]|uniref:DUF6494 family protein n=1 Tax=Halomonas sp. 328 TaxID=2776704 RepID=UPI0018A7D69C|nr:DUF6494 family protein [Halomonas sp. 328]MBF8224275.1 hypothetical protein [Halomonas sp. 328]
MNEEIFNLSIRRFLKRAGIGAQREIEHAVEAALAEGRIAVGEPLAASMTLEVGELELRVVFDGDIVLEE